MKIYYLTRNIPIETQNLHTSCVCSHHCDYLLLVTLTSLVYLSPCVHLVCQFIVLPRVDSVFRTWFVLLDFHLLPQLNWFLGLTLACLTT